MEYIICNGRNGYPHIARLRSYCSISRKRKRKRKRRNRWESFGKQEL